MSMAEERFKTVVHLLISCPTLYVLIGCAKEFGNGAMMRASAVCVYVCVCVCGRREAMHSV